LVFNVIPKYIHRAEKNNIYTTLIFNVALKYIHGVEKEKK
jgi:hypothetical protein